MSVRSAVLIIPSPLISCSFKSQADADAAKAKDQGTANPAVYFTAGGLKLQDINGDGMISTADRTDIGSPFPNFTWGFNNNLSYKNFDLSFLLQGVQGG